jgi:hypothetical protein
MTKNDKAEWLAKTYPIPLPAAEAVLRAAAGDRELAAYAVEVCLATAGEMPAYEVAEKLVALAEGHDAATAELVKAAIHFVFDDGTDCYQFELRCEGRDHEAGRTYPPGTVLWEARGCVEGEPVRWFETMDEALEAIGHGRDG